MSVPFPLKSVMASGSNPSFWWFLYFCKPVASFAMYLECNAFPLSATAFAMTPPWKKFRKAFKKSSVLRKSQKSEWRKAASGEKGVSRVCTTSVKSFGFFMPLMGSNKRKSCFKLILHSNRWFAIPMLCSSIKKKKEVLHRVPTHEDKLIGSVWLEMKSVLN